MPEPESPYRETLHVPASWWVVALGLALSVWWAFIVATTWQVAAVAGLVATVVIVTGLLRYGGVRLSVDERGFSAGRAHLPWMYLGAVEPLGKEETRRAAGVDADARAHLLLRSYCPGAVKVVVADPVDPAPYWLVSTRRADDLAARLDRGVMQD